MVDENFELELVIQFDLQQQRCQSVSLIIQQDLWRTARPQKDSRLCWQSANRAKWAFGKDRRGRETKKIQRRWAGEGLRGVGEDERSRGATQQGADGSPTFPCAKEVGCCRRTRIARLTSSSFICFRYLQATHCCQQLSSASHNDAKHKIPTGALPAARRQLLCFSIAAAVRRALLNLLLAKLLGLVREERKQLQRAEPPRTLEQPRRSRPVRRRAPGQSCRWS